MYVKSSISKFSCPFILCCVSMAKFMAQCISTCPWLIVILMNDNRRNSFFILNLGVLHKKSLVKNCCNLFFVDTVLCISCQNTNCFVTFQAFVQKLLPTSKSSSHSFFFLTIGGAMSPKTVEDTTISIS